MTTGNGRPVKLTKDALVPVGVAITIVLGVAGGMVWLNDNLGTMNHKLDTLSRQVEEVRIRVEDVADDRVTMRQFRNWAKLLQSENKDMKVPLPGD